MGAPSSRTRFLTAEWRGLAMMNYAVEPALLEPFVPRGTELDFFQGRTFVSIVGFRFLNTRVLGWPVPGHRNFEEVNLRFYVRRHVGGETRRGVVFIKELVPRRAIATVARLAYNEPYSRVPMRHAIRRTGEGMSLESVSYQWRIGSEWLGFQIDCENKARDVAPGTQAEFIAEHYWGYCRQRGGGTVEYHVEHPPWNIHQGIRSQVDPAVASFYGDPFVEILREAPDSAFVADGSGVVVGKPRHLKFAS